MTHRVTNVGAVLFRVMPDSFVSGLQRVILHVMELHPELAAKMPVFEDKRKLKLPSLAGLDVFQTHIKAVAGFIKTSRSELNMARLVTPTPITYKPPALVHPTNTIDGSVDFSEGRTWLTPRVTDFTCEKRVITHAMIPPLLHGFSSHYTAQMVTNLARDEPPVLQVPHRAHLRVATREGHRRLLRGRKH